METQALQIVRRGRFWAVHDGAGQLVCVAVYRKGAREVVRRLSPAPVSSAPAVGETPESSGTERARPEPLRKERRHGTRHASYDLHR